MYHTLGVSLPFDPRGAFVSSPVLPAHVLAIARLTFALYALTTLVTSLLWESIRDHIGNTFFAQFTWLSWTGLCAYFWAAGVQTFAYAFSSRRKGRRRVRVEYPLQRWPRFLQFLHVLLFSTITTLPFLVSIVYWAELFLRSGFRTRFSAWSSISAHALNTAFALFELVCTNTPPAPWSHLPFLVLILGGYLGIAYISHASTGIYPYSFLDPKKQGALLAGWILGIAIGACVIFTLVRLLYMLRVRLTYRNTAATTYEREEEQAVTEEAFEEWIEVDNVEQGSPESSPMSRNGHGGAEKGIGKEKNRLEEGAVDAPSA